MTQPMSHQLIGMAAETVQVMRMRMLAAGDSGVDVLRTAGYDGGDAIYSAFTAWLAERGDAGNASELPFEMFVTRADEFFRHAGWGSLLLSGGADGIAHLDVSACWEARHATAMQGPCCHITTGLLAAFFGRVAPYPLAVLETECEAAGGAHCRFVMGPAEAVQEAYESLKL